jgi:CRISPR-associated protein Cas2
MFLVIAYDIVDDKRRSGLAKELENWGQRAQYSVFECDLEEPQAEELLTLLPQYCKEGDSIRVYRICQTCIEKCTVIGGKLLAIDEGFYQV